MESSCECGTEPLGSIKCWKLSNGYTTGGLSSSAQLHRVSWFVGSLVGRSVSESVSQLVINIPLSQASRSYSSKMCFYTYWSSTNK
jgi:hypothetical protein